MSAFKALQQTGQAGDSHRPLLGPRRGMGCMDIRGAVLLCISVTAVLAFTAAPAFAESLWWHVESSSRPTNLQPGLATKSEIQRLTVRATSGEIRIVRNETNEQEFVKFNATHEELQSQLEKLYGAGDVEVPKGEGNAGSKVPYEVIFKGGLSYQPVHTLDTLPAEATVTEVTRGKPDGEIVVTAENLGDATATGEKIPMQITASLPSGLTAVGIAGTKPAPEDGFAERTPLPCSLVSLTCSSTGMLAPFDQVEVRISVVVEPGAVSGELNQASVSGGEGFVCKAVPEPPESCERVSTGLIASASIRRPIVVSGVTTPFGVEHYELANEEEGGAPATQAGGHPFQQTTTLMLNQNADTNPLESGQHKPEVRPAGLAKDLSFKWPPGLIGNPSVVPRCTTAEFFSVVSGIENRCPPQTAVGVALLTAHEPGTVGTIDLAVPLFNLEPHVGEPARFGFFVTQANAPAYIDTAVRTGSDYGVTVSSNNITQTAGFLSAAVTVWGVPGDPRHASQRGWGCLELARGLAEHPPCNASEEPHPSAFLSLPTSCIGPLNTSVEGDTWPSPTPKELASFELPALDGCNRLPFSPSITAMPDTSAASSPTGMTVDVHVPQEESLNASGLAEADPRNITVALPAGVAVNPSSGDGLAACSESLAGFTGFTEFEPLAKTATFTERLPSPLQQGVNFCPDASKIGTVMIKTPILPNPIEGAVYIASQNQNPFESLLALYVVAEDPVSGVLIKLTGSVHLSETGQIVTTFENDPQAPFEDAEFHFFGGERAPLSTPARCGAYTTVASLAPWSGNPASGASSTFDVTSGPHGSPCPGQTLAFAPSMKGGTTNINAGAFSPLTTSIGREDGNQGVQSVRLHLPAGLDGILTGVKLCPEQQANDGTCGPESQLGETTVSAGVGNDPVTVKGGRVYITEKYAGSPFGLSIVSPVKAGPFDLERDTANPSQQPACDCVVVRAKIEVDPHTAELTITTDSSGPHAIPHVIDGIPIQIKNVNVLINRPKFAFNPTDCNPLTLAGTIAGDEGASSPVAVPFQVTNCAILKFTPKFAVTTAARTSKTNGASLIFKIAYPPGAMGTQAWFRQAKFDIPKQLPARLTTIQKACVASTFNINPAVCPAGSLIGHAIVHTPVLPVPLAGPVYFVSHGGAKFPDAVLVLQGYGVNFDLVGETFINGKTGVTSATFASTPDVPFESIEVTVPSGPTSEFGANLPAKAKGSLCGQRLIMPTRFKAQNGLEVSQNTRVAVTGCPTARSVRARKLAVALRACERKPPGRRATCARAALRRYGVAKKR